MAALEIKLLGSFRVSRAGVPIINFKSNKERALLAYLAVESRKQHHRCVLASMLWPDLPEQSALSNLRNNISFLRKLLGDREPVSEEVETGSHANRSAYLLVNRDTIQFNQESDYSLDFAQFTRSVQGDQPVEVLEEALALVEGEFLDGFNLKNSSFFEKWIMLQREQIDQLVNLTLRTVANEFENRKSYEKALGYARRQLEYMPWSEETNRQLIRLYGLTGNMKQAAIQFEKFKHTLWDEFGVEPDSETIALYEQVRDGKMKANWTPVTAPTTTTENNTLQRTDFFHPSFETSASIYGRSVEIQKLHQNLAMSNRGFGKIVFVAGEMGSGKTTLVKEFSQQAMKENPELIVASGSPVAPGGAIGMYLPIRELTQLLCADNETRKIYCSLTQEQARRLERFSPLCLKVFNQFAPTLVEMFLSPSQPKHQASQSQNGSRAADGNLATNSRLSAYDPSLDWVYPMHAEIFDQFFKALKFLSFQQPLLIVLDDMQWADNITVNLLQYLGRRLEGSRILIIGIYRSDEVAVRKNGERHVLSSLVNELRMIYGDIMIDLELSNGRQFLNELFDDEPNRFGDTFRNMFYDLTGGNPLLATELLEDLKERRIIVQDEYGFWIQRGEICWERLPQRVEGMIEECISPLPENYHRMLMVASVEDPDFVPAVVASILRYDEDKVEQAMSGPLSQVHRIVAATGLDCSGKRYITRYRFTKKIYQVYFYNHLDEVQRNFFRVSAARLMAVLLAGGSQVLSHDGIQLPNHLQQTRL